MNGPEKRIAMPQGAVAERRWDTAGFHEPAPSTARVVALGGGTGLPVVLQGLKAAFFPRGAARDPERGRDRITGVVTVADDGGSSGRLRRAYRVLPPGDLRRCLLALADGDPTMTAIFRYRFDERGELHDLSLGDLILTALSQLEHDFSRAAEKAGEILTIRGRVFPSTREDVTLVAELTDGTYLHGESRISMTHRPIRQVRLDPEQVSALPEVIEAIEAADLVVIGPGSLYTTLIPILLVRDVARAVARSRARVVLVMNLMTEPRETDGHTAADFVRVFRQHAPGLPIHDALITAAPIPAHLAERYAAMGSFPIPTDPGSLRALGCRPVERDLLEFGPLVRHDPRKLGAAIVDLAGEGRP